MDSLDFFLLRKLGVSIKQYIGVRFVLISRIRVFAAPVPKGVHACGIYVRLVYLLLHRIMLQITPNAPKNRYAT